MNIVGVLRKELSKPMCDRIMKYIGSNQGRFAELVSIFLNGPYQFAQRASWPLSYCVEQHPELIKPHLKRVINNLKKQGLSDAVKRSTVRLLQFVDIPEALQGEVAIRCFEYLSNPEESISTRVFSITVLANICQSHPELIREFQITLEDQSPYGSAGFVNRATKVLKALGSISQKPR